MTSKRLFDVPVVCEFHVVPLSEVRMVPDAPTETNLLFAKVTPSRPSAVPEVLSVQLVPSVELRMVPELPTVTYVLFP